MKPLKCALAIKALMLGRRLVELLAKGAIVISLNLVLILAAMTLTFTAARVGLGTALFVLLACELVTIIAGLALLSLLKGDQ